MFTRSATLPFESVARMNFRLRRTRPGTVQVVDLLLGEPDDAELNEELVEGHPMEIVELGPRERAAPHAFEHRLVEPAPRVGERRPADPQALGAPERLAVADQARPPVDDGTEDIERQRSDRRGVDRHGATVTSERAIVNGASSEAP